MVGIKRERRKEKSYVKERGVGGNTKGRVVKDYFTSGTIYLSHRI